MGFLAIRNKATNHRVDNKSFDRMIKSLNRLVSRSKSFYLREMYKSIFDWERVHQQKLNLVQNLDDKFTKRKFFSGWITLFNSVHKKYDDRF